MKKIIWYFRIDMVNTLFLLTMIVCTILSFLGKMEDVVQSGVMAMCCLFVFGQILSWGGANEYINDLRDRIHELENK